MTFLPLYGHSHLRARLASAYLDGRLPSSMLFQGQRGIGKQRLAIWLGQLILCEFAMEQKLPEPCGSCQQCRYALQGTHPDLHWFFPRPRLKNPDASTDEVAADMADAIAERMENNGLWMAPPGSDALYVATVRALVRQASMRPAMARRAVFVIGDAERMIAQEGADQAANAFLKLLEEPSPHTTIIITTSEPGSLLPTIRSRVVSFRVPDLSAADMEAFSQNSAVKKRMGSGGISGASAGSRTLAGSPGKLLSSDLSAGAIGAAEELMELALRERSPQTIVEATLLSAQLGVSGARGAFSDMLDALVAVLHDRVQERVNEMSKSGSDSAAAHEAYNGSRAMLLIETAKQRARGNVSPQLIGAELLRHLNMTMRR